MEHGHPLARLAAFVAAARARGRPTRLVLRNTERFGLVHLYFRNGHLDHVEGHLNTPLNSLVDLATWQLGVIRQDEVGSGLPPSPVDRTLETALTDVLRQLEARGVVQPAPPARVWHNGQPGPRSMPTAEMPPLASAKSLPPLTVASDAPLVPAPHSLPAAPAADAMTIPQWQLLALVVHQVVERASELVGADMAAALLRSSLAHVARSAPVLRDVEVDSSVWLKATDETAILRSSMFDVAEAVASLLTNFEVRCASLMGAERAQAMVVSAAAPFRASLSQIGLDVAG